MKLTGRIKVCALNPDTPSRSSSCIQVHLFWSCIAIFSSESDNSWIRKLYYTYNDWLSGHGSNHELKVISISCFNPILTGGGGSIWPPPLHEIRDCLATAADRDTPFHDFFLSSLAHLLIPSLRKSDLRSRGHVTFCTRTSAQNLPKICILHRFVYKTHGNYWFS